MCLLQARGTRHHEHDRLFLREKNKSGDRLGTARVSQGKSLTQSSPKGTINPGFLDTDAITFNLAVC